MLRCPTGHERARPPDRAAAAHRPPRAAAARPAHLGHRPLQLPLPVLHARRDLRRPLRVPAQAGDPLASRRSSGSRASSWRLGVRKLRITGGEPLVRAQLPELVRRLAALEGADDLALTTNGYLLAELAEPLAKAGLRRVTVSLDSLDDAVFREMNGARPRRSRACSRASTPPQRAGLAPIKLNCVVQRGVNDHTLVELVRRFRGSGARGALHRVHGRRHAERLGAGAGRARARDPRPDRRGVPARAARAELPRRSRAALRLRGRRGRDRHHRLASRSRSAATARARACRRTGAWSRACSRPTARI